MSSPDLSVAKQRIAAELAAQTGKLDLSRLNLSELPPELGDLVSLQELNCGGTQVSDLEPLRDLTSLQHLDCRRTQVSDLEPLRGLTSLQHLDCYSTKVSDLEPLVDLQALQSLECINLKISEFPRKCQATSAFGPLAT